MNLKSRGLLLAAVGILLVVGAAADDSGKKKDDAAWRQLIARRLPLFGHRNWIVIADSAYPAQSKPGIETTTTGGEQLDVVEEVLGMLERSKHVRPRVYLDSELPSIEERDAPGIARYRAQLKRLLGRRTIHSLPHERIIEKLDLAGSKFYVLVLKTELTLPYTSVFLELDCGYWSDKAEKRLRDALLKPREP
jgi:hypothetical protein